MNLSRKVQGYWKQVTNTPLVIPPMVYVQPETETLFSYLIENYEKTYQSINADFRRYMREVGAL